MAPGPQLPHVLGQRGAGAAHLQAVLLGQLGRAEGLVAGVRADCVGMKADASDGAAVSPRSCGLAHYGRFRRGIPGGFPGWGSLATGRTRIVATARVGRVCVATQPWSSQRYAQGMTKTDPETAANRPPSRRAPAGAAVLREDVTEAIRAAVFEELAAVGFARMSIEGIARRAGVGKTAVYRRWRSKLSLVLDLVSAFAEQGLPVPHTGSLYGDIRALLAVASLARAPPRRLAGHPRPARRVRTPPGDRRRDQGCAARRISRVSPRSSSARPSNAASCPRGRTPTEPSTLIVGPLYWRLVVVKGALPKGYLDDLAKSAVAALKATG
ncbi:hypothetical protein Sviol_41200 [Streptomyces violascens]|uniref:HTH tetR-type domain-containing protein n=1 Tax=Streptomyces violascens TaxID=67381 RepID=A0ABQ3QR03_9ACTN|nr:hypothetical protein Sviol_41200 [Streptomyces violascens]